MKREGDTEKVGGFAQPSDGWHAFVATNDVGWATDEDKKRKDAVTLPLEVVDDEKEKGRRIWAYCDLTDERGRKDFALFLLNMGLVEGLEKDMGIAEIAGNLNPPEWAEKFLNCKKKSLELINTALKRIPQKAILGDVISYDGKDKDGNKVKKKRLDSIKPYKKGGVREAASESSGEESGSAPASADQADWEE